VDLWRLHGKTAIKPANQEPTHLPWWRPFLILLQHVDHARADPGIFDWGDPNFGSERTVELFCGKLLPTGTTTFSQSVNADRHWRGKYCFASGGEQIIGGYTQNQ